MSILVGFRGSALLIFDEQMLSVTKTNCRSLSKLYEIRQGTADLYTKVGSSYPKEQ